MPKAISPVSAIAAVILTGCISLQAIEPVSEPPYLFSADITVVVEFLPPSEIGPRCAKRGAAFLGLPAMNAGACADASLITMINPCQTFTAGTLAAALCDEIEIARQAQAIPGIGVAGKHEDMHLVTTDLRDDDSGVDAAHPKMTISFLSAEKLASACRHPAPAPEHELLCRVGNRIVARNPCAASSPSWYERVLCHEIGHANGWPASHASRGAEPRLVRASLSPDAVAYGAFE